MVSSLKSFFKGGRGIEAKAMSKFKLIKLPSYRFQSRRG